MTADANPNVKLRWRLAMEITAVLRSWGDRIDNWAGDRAYGRKTQ